MSPSCAVPRKIPTSVPWSGVVCAVHVVVALDVVREALLCSSVASLRAEGLYRSWAGRP